MADAREDQFLGAAFVLMLDGKTVLVPAVSCRLDYMPSNNFIREGNSPADNSFIHS